jgi:hypothetical protein
VPVHRNLHIPVAAGRRARVRPRGVLAMSSMTDEGGMRESMMLEFMNLETRKARASRLAWSTEDGGTYLSGTRLCVLYLSAGSMALVRVTD